MPRQKTSPVLFFLYNFQLYPIKKSDPLYSQVVWTQYHLRRPKDSIIANLAWILILLAVPESLKMTIQENSVVSITQDTSRVGLNYLTFQQSRLCSVVSNSLSVCKYCSYYSNEQIIEAKEPFFSRANKLLVGKWAWIHLRHTRFPRASRPVLFHRFRGTRMWYAINRLSDTWNNFLKLNMQRLAQ